MMKRTLLAVAALALLLALVGSAHSAESQQSTSITINPNGPTTPINPLLLGSNAPAWLAPDTFDNDNFRAAVDASGVTLLRMPGGSWSNAYDWLACERGGQGIDGSATCYWTWASRPSDFIDLIRSQGTAGMYTVNNNGTAKEAAALVAFFNGDVNDTTVIGVDVRGRDWGTVGQWAQLRADNGSPQPLNVKYWEVGNEIYGGKQGSGKDCAAWGWEDVWTCDGTEYVNGIGSGANRHEGYLEFRDAMRAVDDSIWVGAVGIPFQSEWNNWGNEVIAAAGDVMDFYVIHQYGYFEQPADYATALAEPHTTWDAIRADFDQAVATHANGRDIPVAITEYNLFSVQEQDNNQWMTRMMNALYMADTVGQMAVNEFDIGTQWDIANGQPANGTDYGLVHAETYEQWPQYYAYVLWSRFGDSLVPVSNPLSAETTLSVYAGQVDDDTVSLLAINKSGQTISAEIGVDGANIAGGLVDVAKADSLDAKSAEFNGVANPNFDLSNAPSLPLGKSGSTIDVSFAPYSLTLLRLDIGGDATPPTATATNVAQPTATATEPAASPTPGPSPTATQTVMPSATPTATLTPTPGPSPTPTATPVGSIHLPIVTRNTVAPDSAEMMLSAPFLGIGVVVTLLLLGGVGIVIYRRRK